MPTSPNTQGTGMLSVPLTGNALFAGGEIAAVANPEGASLMILRTYLYVKTPSTGAANISIGVAANATTSATDAINALAINGAITGKVYNGNTIQGTTKTEVSVPAVWTADKFVTCTGSADSSGFTGTLYIEYIHLI
jgi:hypothetical protein